jgi:sugar-phosphatase
MAPHLPAVEEAERLTAIESTATDGLEKVQGARDLLQQLPASRWAIVSSGAQAVATLRLAQTHLPKPAVLICAEDVRHGKPDPEGYLAAAHRLGVAPSACVVIEDAPAGLEAARAAGMRCIAVATTHDAAALELATYTVPTLACLSLGAIRDDKTLEIRLAPAP